MFDPERFVAAQAPVIEDVRRELRAGQKRTHWMWFIFPQLAGLGHSEMARRYALGSVAEARAYLAHPVLGPRLVECAGLVNAVQERSLREVLGTPDDLKFRSSMTLFAAVKSEEPVFEEALNKWFGGVGDAGPYPE
jgi:uncharacterized protein (DUF1810 family)